MKKIKYIKLFEDYHTHLFDGEEEKLITVYHGDNYGTTEIKPENMDLDGNMQEGVGIYFADTLEAAKYYGDHIVTARILEYRFIESREEIGEYLEIDQMIGLLEDLWEVDEESMFYLISDYMEIHNPEDIEDYHIEALAEHMKSEQCRNFQIALAQSFGVTSLVEAWVSNVRNIDGTVNSELGFYCIINPKIELNIYSIS